MGLDVAIGVHHNDLRHPFHVQPVPPSRITSHPSYALFDAFTMAKRRAPMLLRSIDRQDAI